MRALAMRATLVAIVTLAPCAASAQELTDYTVREGDTCGQIAERMYGSPRRYDRIHEHNPQLGPMPHRLRAGAVLRLPPPERAAPADATVSDARGVVRSQDPRAAEWQGARVGQSLYSGWRVSTGERSSAELAFRASSVAAIRAETLVIVHGASVERVREEGTRAVLREGSMLSRLSSLSGGAPLTVETPSAEVALTDGEAAVRVSNHGETGVSAHSGRAARVRGSGAMRASEVEVPVGHGSRVRVGAAPEPPRPLPAPPAWPSDQPRAFLGLTGVGATMRGRWIAAPSAARYRVEIARRADGRDLVFATEVPASVTSFEAHHFPAGEYYLRVATIDDALLEGRAPDALALHVVRVALVAPGSEAPAIGAEQGPLDLLEELDALSDASLFADAAPARPEVLVATRVVVPEGVVCAFGASEPAHELTLSIVGDGYLTCVDAQGQNIVGFELRVVETATPIVVESVPVEDVAAPIATAAPIEVAPPPFSVHEAAGLFATPSWVGLRDEQREGHGTWVGVVGASARLGEPDPRVRLVAGVTASMLDEHLRLTAVAPLDIVGQAARSADRGARDVHFSIGSRVVAARDAAGFGLALEAGVWAPTAGDQGLRRGRLSVAADVSLRIAERVALRTRQAGHFDLVASGSLLWASAYGVDVSIAGPLSAGVEGTMTIGSEDGRDWYAGGVGLGVGLDFSPVVISLGGRYGFGDDLWPTLTLTGNARASF